MYLTSLSAEVWLRTIANTLRLERSAAVTADTPILPVAPTTSTVSMTVLSALSESEDVTKFKGVVRCLRGPRSLYRLRVTLSRLSVSHKQFVQGVHSRLQIEPTVRMARVLEYLRDRVLEKRPGLEGGQLYDGD